MRRVASLLAAGTLLLAAPLFAAAPVFTNNFVAVTLDGVRLGTDTDPSNYSMFPTVVYDSSSGLFHMWVAASNALSIEGLRHATSSDGVHFISDGNLSFAAAAPSRPTARRPSRSSSFRARRGSDPTGSWRSGPRTARPACTATTTTTRASTTSESTRRRWR